MASKPRSNNMYTAPCLRSGSCGLRMRLHIIGVSVSETKPEISTATMITTANSCSRRPRMPPMNITGMNTAASEMVIDTMVKAISLEPSSVACITLLPISRCRLTFSSITMASSTTKPTHSVSASSEMLSMLWPNMYMKAKVPMIDIGSATLGMMVAGTLRRKMKITMITSASATISVNCTSWTEARMVTERSNSTSMSMPGGTSARKVGSSFLTASTTSMVFTPGWRWMARTMPRLALNQAATLSDCTPSVTRPTSERRIGEPLR